MRKLNVGNIQHQTAREIIKQNFNRNIKLRDKNRGSFYINVL